MENSVVILSMKRRKLVDQKIQLQRDYERQVKAIDEEIGQIDSALKLIDKAAEPYRCKACKGTGVRVGADAAGGREERTCEKCKGTGFDISV